MDQPFTLLHHASECINAMEIGRFRGDGRGEEKKASQGNFAAYIRVWAHGPLVAFVCLNPSTENYVRKSLCQSSSIYIFILGNFRRCS